MQNKVNEQRQMHRVNVTVSQPDHTMVSKRKDRVQKIVAVRADSRDHALSKATQYYKDRGYKVHGQEYIGLKEEVKEQFAIVHKVAKKVLSTHDDEASAKDEWKGLDQSERPFYKIVKTNKKPKDFSMKEQSVAQGSVNEASYNDDDHYAIHPDSGKVMDSWSKRDSRVNALNTQQHKDKGHVIKTGRELNYAEYAKSKNESVDHINESHFKVGQRVRCIKSGIKGKVIKLDAPQKGKYYTVKQDSGKMMKYAPNELKALNEMTNISQAIDSLIKEHTENISEKLNLAKADMGDVIKDFQTSDAPQFQGKSKEKRRQMAIAAKLGAERGARNEETEDEYEYDREGDMAKTDLRSIIANAQRVHDMLEDDSNLPEWVQSKITLAEDYISTVANYMSAEKEE